MFCGAAGTLTTLRPGAVHIEMSTIDVGRKSAIRDAVQRRGGDMLDCPISGSPAMVAPRRADRAQAVAHDDGTVADSEQAADVLRGLDVADAPLVEHDRLLAPLHWPRKVMCAGVNYRRHMREMGGEIPRQAGGRSSS